MERKTPVLRQVPMEQLIIPDYPNYLIAVAVKIRFVFESKKVGKSNIWSTLDIVTHFFNSKLVRLISTKTNKPAYQSEYDFGYTTEEHAEQSELEKKINKLMERKIVDESYAVDLFKQEQIFKDNLKNLVEKNIEEVLVCGDKIFTGNEFEELLKKARSEFGTRPFYSYSFKNEPLTL